jgi:hypothetical protein
LRGGALAPAVSAAPCNDDNSSSSSKGRTQEQQEQQKQQEQQEQEEQEEQYYIIIQGLNPEHSTHSRGRSKYKDRLFWVKTLFFRLAAVARLV